MFVAQSIIFHNFVHPKKTVFSDDYWFIILWSAADAESCCTDEGGLLTLILSAPIVHCTLLLYCWTGRTTRTPPVLWLVLGFVTNCSSYEFKHEFHDMIYQCNTQRAIWAVHATNVSLVAAGSWPCNLFVGEASAISQPTRPTQPAIPPGSVKWVVIH